MRHDIGVSGACELLGVTKQAWYSYHQRSFEQAMDYDRLLSAYYRYVRICQDPEAGNYSMSSNVTMVSISAETLCFRFCENRIFL